MSWLPKRKSRRMLELKVNGVPVKFKLDTGAEANVLPLSTFQTLKSFRLKPAGVVQLECVTPKVKTNLLFYVTKHSQMPILSREACELLQLVKKVETLDPTPKRPAPASKEELVAMYPSVFEGLGQFPGEHHIYVNPDVPPVIHGCRKIPLAVMDRLKRTLNQLLETGVIAKVTEPTAWVNSLVITEKRNGSLRVCLDPKDLNKAILRCHYSIPTTEDVLCKLAGKEVFTILDEKDGYWQLD